MPKNYKYTIAISIPISTWLGDRFGLKKIYIIAMLLFGAGSTLCYIATHLNQLIFFRFVQGIGGGMLNLKFFKNDLFAHANLIQICFQACHFGAIFLLVFFLQAGVGFSAALAGLMLGMQAIGAMVTSRYSVKLFNQYGARLPIIIGLAGIAFITPMIMLIDRLN